MGQSDSWSREGTQISESPLRVHPEGSLVHDCGQLDFSGPQVPTGEKKKEEDKITYFTGLLGAIMN